MKNKNQPLLNQVFIEIYKLRVLEVCQNLHFSSLINITNNIYLPKLIFSALSVKI